MLDGIAPSGGATQSNLVKVPGGPSSRLGVILSKNTIANTDYLFKRYDIYKKEFGDTPYLDPIGLLVEPKFAIYTLASHLKNKFGSVDVVGDTQDFKAGSFDVLAVVDIYYEPKSPGLFATIEDTTARVTLSFFDRDVRYIASAGGETMVTRNSPSCCAGHYEFVQDTKRHHSALLKALRKVHDDLDMIVVAPPPPAVKPLVNLKSKIDRK